jgi:uncharacterized protein
LQSQQVQLSQILETATDVTQAQKMLAASVLAHSDWQIERWDMAMLETAMAIAQKWKKGFESV